jgi:hypothetical protein
MTGPIAVGEPLQLVMAAWLGEDGQREDSDTDAKGKQRGDGMPDMGGPLTRWPASVLKPKAAEGAGQHQLAPGDEHRDGVLHAWMLADSWPWVLLAWPDGGS